MDAIEQIASEIGFECMGMCSAKELVAREEVRSMCSANKCQVFDHSWACPPACGDIAYFQERMRAHEHCLIVQTVAEMEDDFDVETMEEAGERQKQRVLDLVEAIDKAGLSAETMTLSAGTCTLCKTCTYPDEPCRFPDKRLVSMEAAGLVVSEVCMQAGIEYNHGPLTMTYSGCVLYN
jgi:predicted metal-binding protein